MPKRNIEIDFEGTTLRGYEHLPESATSHSQVPVAILLPGLGGTMSGPHGTLVELSNALEAQNFASIRFDFLGAGESDGVTSDTTLTSQVHQALHIMSRIRNDQRFDRNNINLVGFSMGGLVAALVAGLAPSTIRSVVLISPTFNLRSVAEGFNERVTDEHPELNYYGNKYSKLLLDDVLSTNIEQLCGLYQGDVLVLSGGRDAMVRTSDLSTFVQRIYGGRAKHFVVEEANHSFQHYLWKEYLIKVVVESILRHPVSTS